MCKFVDKSAYTLLGLEPTANVDQLRRAYRRAALLAHPDKGGSAEAFRAITTAFEVLSSTLAHSPCDQVLATASSCTLDEGCNRAVHQIATPLRCQIKTNAKNGVRVPVVKRGATRLVPSSTLRERNLKRWCTGPVAANPVGGMCADTGAAETTTTSGLPPRPSYHLVSAPSQKLNTALLRLRETLQSMTSTARQAAIQGMPPRTRAALVTFIEAENKREKLSSFSPPPSEEAPFDAVGQDPVNSSYTNNESRRRVFHTHDSQRRRLGRTPLSGFTGVRAVTARTYKAYMDIKALRLYTHGQQNIEIAIEQHIVLVNIRQTLAAASTMDPNFWHRIEKIYQICNAVLQANGTSEEKLGLHAFVSFRADKWLGRCCHITSPVLSLAEALQVHSRMLHARATSWDTLRKEWVQLAQHKKRALVKGMSPSQAEAFIDKARQNVLEQKLGKAMCAVARALKIEEQRAAKAMKARARADAQEKRRVAKADLASVRAMRSQAKLHQERWRWMRRRDLTTEEIMHGPPPHLRNL